MSLQKQAGGPQAEGKSSHKPENIVLPERDLLSREEDWLGMLPLEMFGPGTIRGGNLNDLPLPTVQRQALASQIGQAYGNAALRKLAATSRNQVMRQPTTSDGTAAPAAAPTTDGAAQGNSEYKFTPYGTFEVYPDDFVGPLPVANYAEGFWPVRQAVYNQIESVVASIGGGGAGFILSGDQPFKSAVLMDLAWLMTSGVGMELIEAIVATGKTLTILSTTGGNTTAYIPDADSYEIPSPTGEGPPAPGPGANVVIEYNTSVWNPYGDVEVWMTRPPAIGLAHEMVHAWTGMSGIRAVGETGGVRRRELQATGLGEFANAVLSENRFRAAFGLPPRPRY